MATITLDRRSSTPSLNLPERVASAPCRRHRQKALSLRRRALSLQNEAFTALALADSAASGPTPQPAPGPVAIRTTLRRMQEISAGLRAKAAAEGRPILELPPRPPMTEAEQAAEHKLFAHLRSQFKGPPLTSEEIIAAIERESHPPEMDRLGFRIAPET